MSETMFYILSSLRQERHGYGIMLHVKEITQGRIVPVSYTHLDVYKRQALCWLHAWSRQPPASITATSAALQAAFVPLFILSILLIFHSPYLSGKIQAFNGGGEHKESRFWADPYLSFRSQKRRASLKSLSNAYFILLYYSRKKCENHLFSSDRRGFWLNFALKMV